MLQCSVLPVHHQEEHPRGHQAAVRGGHQRDPSHHHRDLQNVPRCEFVSSVVLDPPSVLPKRWNIVSVSLSSPPGHAVFQITVQEMRCGGKRRHHQEQQVREGNRLCRFCLQVFQLKGWMFDSQNRLDRFLILFAARRCNIPPINEKYSADVGTKTDLVSINPSIITERWSNRTVNFILQLWWRWSLWWRLKFSSLCRFQKLEKWRRPFYEVLQNYENSSVVLPAFYNTRNTDVSFRVKYMLDDFDSQRGVFFFHPQYLLNVQRFWAVQGIRAKRLSSGLMLVTAALEMCEEVHLYGFWAFPMNPSGIFITHHYYDNVKPRPGFHAMPHEIFNFIHMHTRGIVNVHTGRCVWDRAHHCCLMVRTCFACWF